MAKISPRIENPTLEASDFRRGDFAYWLLNDTQPSFGVVTGMDNGIVELTHFDDGFPFEVFRTPRYGSVKKSSKEEALRHFHKISSGFGYEFEAGGLSGAVYARQQHYIDGVIAQLETNNNRYLAATTPPPEPNTGTYVLRGVYSGYGPSRYLQGLILTPRFPENVVEEILKHTHPEGFGRIPGEISSLGGLQCYWAYEVPEKALHFLFKPIANSL